MSTLKVNTIEPYSGGTVTITGFTPTNATSASYATVAENLTAGNKTLNGNLTVNGTSQLNGNVTVPNSTITVINTANSGSSIIGDDTVGLKTYDADGVILAKVETGYGGSIGFFNTSTTDDIGLTLQQENWGFLGDWTGPALYADDPSGDYPALIGFQNKATWTDGRVTFLTPTVMKTGMTIEGLGDYADDTAAAAGGVAVNGVYRTGSVLKIRVS